MLTATRDAHGRPLHVVLRSFGGRFVPLVKPGHTRSNQAHDHPDETASLYRSHTRGHPAGWRTVLIPPVPGHDVGLHPTSGTVTGGNAGLDSANPGIPEIIWEGTTINTLILKPQDHCSNPGLLASATARLPSSLTALLLAALSLLEQDPTQINRCGPPCLPVAIKKKIEGFSELIDGELAQLSQPDCGDLAIGLVPLPSSSAP